MKRLYFLRHGLAVNRALWSGPDADRPLSEKGKKKTQLVAQGLNRWGLTFEVILSSPYVRTFETAQIVKMVYQFADSVILEPALQPGKNFFKIFPNFFEQPAQSFLLVGHESHLSETIQNLLSLPISPAFQLKKAGICGIELQGTAKSYTAQLLCWVPPSILKLLSQS